MSHDDVLALSPFEAVSFAMEQRKDPECLALIQHLDGPVLSSGGKFIRKSQHFVLLGGILHGKDCSSLEWHSVTSGSSHPSFKGNAYVFARRSDSRAFGIFEDV